MNPTHGIQLTSIKTLSALGNPTTYLPDFGLRLLRTSASLLGLQGPSFDLRLVKKQGEVMVALLFRDADPQTLLAQLQASLLEYALAPLAPDQLPTWLEPFPLIQIATLQRRLNLVGQQEQINLLGLAPLLPGNMDWPTVFRQIATWPDDLLISLCFQPTRATPAEQQYALEQLGEYQEQLGGHEQWIRDYAKSTSDYLFNWKQGLQGRLSEASLLVASARPQKAIRFALLADTLGAIPGTLEAHLLDQQETELARQSLRAIKPYCPLWATAPGPAERLTRLYTHNELAALFPLPPASEIPYPGWTTEHHRTQPLTVGLDQGLLLGHNHHQGHARAVRLSLQSLRRHLYLTGQTGTGKTTTIIQLVLDAMHQGQGLCVVDPHGDLYQTLLGLVPTDRLGDVICIDPTDLESPVGLNLLEATPEDRYRVAQEFGEIVFRLMVDEYGPDARSFMGPVFFQHVRMMLLLLMSNPDQPGTLVDLYYCFQDDGYRDRWLPLGWREPMLVRFVNETLRQQSYTNPGNDNNSVGNWIAGKFQGLVFDPMLRGIFGQPRSTLNLLDAINSSKIVLVNLAKGQMGIQNARFFGMVFLSMLYSAVLQRGKLPEEERKDFMIVVDEFQSLATTNFINLLSEGRKFGVNLVLANQFLSQIQDPRIIQGILGNVGTLLAFRLGLEDAERLEGQFYPQFSRHDLINLPNWLACARTLKDGQRTLPFTLHTTPAPVGDSERGMQVAEWSRNRYGTPTQSDSLNQPSNKAQPKAENEFDQALAKILEELKAGGSSSSD